MKERRQNAYGKPLRAHDSPNRAIEDGMPMLKASLHRFGQGCLTPLGRHKQPLRRPSDPRDHGRMQNQPSSVELSRMEIADSLYSRGKRKSMTAMSSQGSVKAGSARGLAPRSLRSHPSQRGKAALGGVGTDIWGGYASPNPTKRRLFVDRSARRTQACGQHSGVRSQE